MQKANNQPSHPGGGGTHIGKLYRNVPQSWPPFSGQSALLSLSNTVNAPLMCPPFLIFGIFWPLFGQSFSSLDPNFQNFCSQGPHFSKKICSLDLLLETHVAHTQQKKSWVPPGPLVHGCLIPLNTPSMCKSVHPFQIENYLILNHLRWKNSSPQAPIWSIVNWLWCQENIS